LDAKPVAMIADQQFLDNALGSGSTDETYKVLKPAAAACFFKTPIAASFVGADSHSLFFHEIPVSCAPCVGMLSEIVTP
jgi:hypothetical protein